MAARNHTLLFSPGFQQLLDRLLDREIKRVSQILDQSKPAPKSKDVVEEGR